MTSSIFPPRSALAPCSPSTQLMASTTLLLPEPFGPTTQVIPGSRRSVVAEAKDLKPFSVRLFRCTRTPPTGRPLVFRGWAQAIEPPRQFRELRGHQPSTNPRRSPRAGVHCPPTCRTTPGACPPRRASSRASQAARSPSAPTATRPSVRLRAEPTSPSSSALDRVHQRKPTPCTKPSTQAVRRTTSPVPALSESVLTIADRTRQRGDGWDVPGDATHRPCAGPDPGLRSTAEGGGHRVGGG